MHCGDRKYGTEWPGSKTHVMINQMTKQTEKKLQFFKKFKYNGGRLL
jgi:hypothetical protein